MTQTEKTFLNMLSRALGASVPDEPTAGDDGELLSLAAAHKLVPLLSTVFPAGEIPAQWKRQTLQQAVLQTRRTSAFLALYRQMEEAGLHPLVVKGILCRSLYPQPDLRPSSDEDLFVPREEFAAFCSFFREQGFTPTGEVTDHAFEIGWRKDLLYIELHQSLFAPESGAYGDLNRFFTAGGTPYSVEWGASIRSLDPHHHMLYLILHAFKHFLHSGFGIRQVCDICLWARKYSPQIRWSLLRSQCAEAHALGFARAVLGIGMHHLGVSLPLPEDWLTEPDYALPMLRDILSGGIYGGTDAARQHTATVTLNAVEASRTGKASTPLSSVFPSRASLMGRYPYLKQHPILLPLAWSQRIFRYLREKSSPGESLALGKTRVELLKYYGVIS
jgi:hypothetical protein